MHQITVHHDFDTSTDVLWDLLSDFAHIERWWPKDIPAVQIERVDLEGEGIGLIRHIYNKGFAAPVSERAQSGHEPALQLSARTAISTGARYRPQLHELRIAVDQRPRRQREALRRKPHPDAKQDDQVRRPAAIDDRLRAERWPLGHA